mmetsp:Transcript_96866/g.172398  ORF Transcript_96866/g.172398 Transcript_96866/m.172398 type:complete len:451 (-) Transcript_96866:55-1407(-)
MAGPMLADDDDMPGADEIKLPAVNSWEFPLTRFEKMQRLLHLFESELEAREDEIETLKEQNAVLSQALSAAQASAQNRKEDPIEATLQLRKLPGNCTIRGTPTQLGAIMQALGAQDGYAEPRPARLSTTSSLHGSSASSSAQSTPASSPRGMATRPQRPMLPGLPLGSLQRASAATPRLSVGSRKSLGNGVGATPRLATPRVFSIRTPPNRTPRVLAAASMSPAMVGTSTPRATLGTPSTPRTTSRIWSLVTPRASPGESYQEISDLRGVLDPSPLPRGLVPLAEDDDRRKSSPTCSDHDVDPGCEVDLPVDAGTWKEQGHEDEAYDMALEDILPCPPGLHPDTGGGVWSPKKAGKDGLASTVNQVCSDSMEAQKAQETKVDVGAKVVEISGLAFHAAGAAAAGARVGLNFALSRAREGAAVATAATEAVAENRKRQRRQKCVRAMPRRV